MADTIEPDLRPAGTHFRTAKIRRTLQEAEKMGPIISTQIPLRRSYTFKEHLRLYFNLNRIKVCAFGAINQIISGHVPSTAYGNALFDKDPIPYYP